MRAVPGLADAQVDAFLSEVASDPDAGVEVRTTNFVDVQDTVGGEQAIIRAVAEGQLELGWIGARAFRELGVTSFDPLVAPMVLDSLDAQRAVLESDLPAEMLAGLEPLGVTGLAVIGGPIRRPVAAGVPLRSLADFGEVPFYAWHGELNALAVEALGAQLVDLSPEDRNDGIAEGSIQAYETTVGFVAANPDWRTNTMTLDINLWPSMSVLVVNPDALAALSEEAATRLRNAATSVAAQSLELLPDERGLIEEACDGGASFALAGAEDLAEIEAAFSPVLDQLRSDATVAAHLDEIERLIAGIPADVGTIPDQCIALVPDG